MNGWMNGWMYGWKIVRMGRSIDGWMDGCMYWCVDGWVDRWVGGWMDGWQKWTMFVCIDGWKSFFFTSLFRTCFIFKTTAKISAILKHVRMRFNIAVSFCLSRGIASYKMSSYEELTAPYYKDIIHQKLMELSN